METWKSYAEQREKKKKEERQAWRSKVPTWKSPWIENSESVPSDDGGANEVVTIVSSDAQKKEARPAQIAMKFIREMGKLSRTFWEFIIFLKAVQM